MVSIISKNIIQKSWLNASKQMKIEEEAPVIIMDMTRALGFRDDYDRFYSLFVKEVRDGKLGNYTLDTLEDLDGDD